jgi:arylsulfatase A-like enzyme
VPKLSALLLCVFSLSLVGADTVSKPNVLFIGIDDLNNWVGCLGGHPQAKTPNLDRLAASGVLFTNAYSPAPACNPSRSSVLTGIPCHQSGLYSNRQMMREVMPNAVTIPAYFSQQGYWSIGSGKMLHYFIDARSWDDYYPDKNREDPFPPWCDFGARPKNLPRAGLWQYAEADWGALQVTDKEFGGDYLVTDWVSRQLAAPQEKPFFLACGIYRPHEPWFVPQKYLDLFPLDSVQMPPGYRENDLDDLPATGKKIGPNRYLEHIKSHGQWKKGVQAYLACIAYADAMLGRVMDALDQSPHRDSTIVVLWSDHGFHLGEKEHWQKFTGWRQSTHVPFIIHVPPGVPGLPAGTKAGTRCTHAVNLVDMYRTLTDLCGLPAKADVSPNSLVPLLADPQAAWPHPSLTHLEKPDSYAISFEDWRYIHYEDGGEELYDIRNDPYEWKNLAALPEFAAKLESMRQLVPKVRVPLAQPTLPNPALAMSKDFTKPIPHSKNAGGEVELVFINYLGEDATLYFVNEAGERIESGTLKPIQTKRVKANVGHVWLITDKDGKNVGYFTAESDSARAEIMLVAK